MYHSYSIKYAGQPHAAITHYHLITFLFVLTYSIPVFPPKVSALRVDSRCSFSVWYFISRLRSAIRYLSSSVSAGQQVA